MDQKTLKRMLGECQTRFYVCKKIWKGQWSFIGLGSERSGTGTIWLQECCWNSQKVIVQFSALRAHCPEVDSEAKDMENCRYTMQPIWK